MSWLSLYRAWNPSCKKTRNLYAALNFCAIGIPFGSAFVSKQKYNEDNPVRSDLQSGHIYQGANLLFPVINGSFFFVEIEQFNPCKPSTTPTTTVAGLPILTMFSALGNDMFAMQLGNPHT
ncbi:MAG: hypothetical protein K9H16_08755 [Bacteroidales bacterium]|nr:hypothetical protein [Bacteroidales bacterium]